MCNKMETSITQVKTSRVANRPDSVIYREMLNIADFSRKEQSAINGHIGENSTRPSGGFLTPKSTGFSTVIRGGEYHRSIRNAKIHALRNSFNT